MRHLLFSLTMLWHSSQPNTSKQQFKIYGLISMILMTMLLSCHSTKNQSDTNEKSIVILEYGLMPTPSYLMARDKIAKKWGIEFEYVSGCVVDTALLRRVEEQNAITYTRIKKKYDENWSTTFDKEVAIELDKIEENWNEKMKSNKNE